MDRYNEIVTAADTPSYSSDSTDAGDGESSDTEDLGEDLRARLRELNGYGR